MALEGFSRKTRVGIVVVAGGRACYLKCPKSTIMLINSSMVLIGWTLAATLVSAASPAEQATPKYFRSDKGVAGPAAGRLPDHLEAPGALRWRTAIDPG